jgi:hypothetical protein
VGRSGWRAHTVCPNDVGVRVAGEREGVMEGDAVGGSDGDAVGDTEGVALGACEGDELGAFEGDALGACEGATVSCCCCVWPTLVLKLGGSNYTGVKTLMR